MTFAKLTKAVGNGFDYYRNFCSSYCRGWRFLQNNDLQKIGESEYCRGSISDITKQEEQKKNEPPPPPRRLPKQEPPPKIETKAFTPPKVVRMRVKTTPPGGRG